MKFFLFLFLLYFGFPLVAVDLRWSPSELIQSLPAGPLDASQATLIALSLENIPSSEINYYLSKIQKIWEGIKPELEGLSTPDAKGDNLLQILHEKGVLKRYQTTQTRLSTLLDRGDFNCVSSSLLYGILGSYLELEIAYVGTRDHVFCVLDTPGKKIDVETTTALGFDPGLKRDFVDQFGKITGFSYVPPGKYTTRNTLDFRGLLGLLIQNLIAEAQQKNDPFNPMGWAWDRWALEQTPESRTFLLQNFKNLSAHRNQRKDFTLGLEEIARMKQTFGPDPLLSLLHRDLANNLLVQYFNEESWLQARLVVEKEKDALGTLYFSWKANLELGEAKYIYTLGGWEELRIWVYGDKSLTSNRQEDILEPFSLQEASKLVNSKKYKDARSFISQLPESLRARPQVAQLEKTIIYNMTVDIHNQFVDLMNNRDLQGAREVLSRGLVDFPHSEILLQDFRLLKD